MAPGPPRLRSFKLNHLPMRTLLSQFCEEFDGVVRPLLDPFQRSAQVLSESGDERPWKVILPGLLDLRHQLRTLADKVAEQQAYVLIFGPLKSGKSTLMNAVSAAYVSEVTSLPAYPCMVYCSHAETREFTLTNYKGEEQSFTDTAALRMQINRAHTELADRIRASEGSEEEFDPAIHFPQAIRRIDVKTPAGNLQTSGAVLVDTPGLYSRMKFGYDRMTREFRNSAACAIFVVKSDNLFLEQVFNEFTELLNLFSRIFLVVNLDSSKMDLKPDGSLVPSLEKSDPIRIIEAFENLSMSAPLKAAADEGKLKLYPVDLLRAASRRLTGDNDGEAFDGQANFDAFLGDLTDYLNSTDYLLAFLGDSLRQAQTLMAETKELCEHDGVKQLDVEVERLDRDSIETQDRISALKRLVRFDWKDAFGGLTGDLSGGAREQAKTVEEKTAHALDGALESWFENDSSLSDLLDGKLGPVLRSYQDEVALYVHKALSDRIARGNAGVLVPTSIQADLTKAGISLTDIGRKALEGVQVESVLGDISPPLRSEDIPVKKTFWDWILFRSKPSVRRKLFGPTNSPSVRIQKADKARRIGAPGKTVMRNTLDEYRGTFFPLSVQQLTERILGSYAEIAVAHIADSIGAKSGASAKELQTIQAELKEFQKTQNHLTELQFSMGQAQGAIGELSDLYGQTDPDDLIQPFSPPPIQNSDGEEEPEVAPKIETEDAPEPAN